MSVNKDNSAIVLFSGGQDSTTCLFWAMKHFERVRAISFAYGQKHILENEISCSIAEDAGVEYELVDLGIMGKLSRNALTDSTLEMDADKPESGCPNSFVPGRNLFFLTVAAVRAYDLGIGNLVTGVSQADYSGYPDCREDFIESAQRTISLALDYPIRIHTPLMYLDKSQVWDLSDELGVFDLVRTRTLTCYNGIVAEGCGHCPSCRLRNEGLKKYLDRRVQ